MDDYMRDDEIAEAKALIKKRRWSHSFTLTSGKDDPSYWDVVLLTERTMQRLLKQDKTAKWVGFVCVNRKGISTRPHAHGLLQTALDGEALGKVLLTASHHCRRFRDDRVVKDRKAWRDYVLDHAISSTMKHNI